MLKETNGEFGPRVKESLFDASNIFSNASKSGKLTKTSLETWYKEIFFPCSSSKCLLLVDSWTTYNDPKLTDNNKPCNTDFKQLVIAKHTTSLIQLLDVYCFRSWKQFVRKISDYVLLHDINLI